MNGWQRWKVQEELGRNSGHWQLSFSAKGSGPWLNLSKTVDLEWEFPVKVHRTIIFHGKTKNFITSYSLQLISLKQKKIYLEWPYILIPKKEKQNKLCKLDYFSLIIVCVCIASFTLKKNHSPRNGTKSCGLATLTWPQWGDIGIFD